MKNIINATSIVELSGNEDNSYPIMSHVDGIIYPDIETALLNEENTQLYILIIQDDGFIDEIPPSVLSLRYFTSSPVALISEAKLSSGVQSTLNAIGIAFLSQVTLKNEIDSFITTILKKDKERVLFDNHETNQRQKANKLRQNTTNKLVPQTHIEYPSICLMVDIVDSEIFIPIDEIKNFNTLKFSGLLEQTFSQTCNQQGLDFQFEAFSLLRYALFIRSQDMTVALNLAEHIKHHFYIALDQRGITGNVLSSALKIGITQHRISSTTEHSVSRAQAALDLARNSKLTYYVL